MTKKYSNQRYAVDMLKAPIHKSPIQPNRQEFTENECEALPGVAYPGVRDNRTTVDTKTGYMMKRIRPESRFLPTPLAFDAPVRGIPIGISPSRSRKN